MLKGDVQKYMYTALGRDPTLQELLDTWTKRYFLDDDVE